MKLALLPVLALFALLLVTAAVSAVAAEPAPAPPADSAAAGALVPGGARVDSLLLAALARMAGVVPGSDSLVAWDLFRAHAQRTVELVMPTLAPLRRDLYLGAPNMVWRVRVLQRLTGLEFRAPTRSRLTREEIAHLAPDTLRVVRFAGEDRNLGLTWTAPADAQKAILAKWREWWDMDTKKPALPMKRHDDDRTWWY